MDQQTVVPEQLVADMHSRNANRLDAARRVIERAEAMGCMFNRIEEVDGSPSWSLSGPTKCADSLVRDLTEYAEEVTEALVLRQAYLDKLTIMEETGVVH